MNLFLFLLFSAVWAYKPISYQDKNIRYYGRWQSSYQHIQSSWPGAYFKVTLDNTRTVQLQLDTPASLFILLNQERLSYANVSAGTLDLSALLRVGQNNLLIMNTDTTANFSLKSILVDTTGITVPTPDIPLIEYIGHDLTLGLHTNHTLLSSYAYLSSALLGVEHTHIAYKDATLLGMNQNYFSSLDYHPWGVVLFIGTNDNCTPEEYRQTLNRFILHLRTLLTTYDPIFILSEPLGDRFHPTQQAVLDLMAVDSSVYFVDTTAWIRYGKNTYVDRTHWTDMGHALFAKKLAPLLQLKLNDPHQPLPGPAPNPNLPGDWQTMDIGEDVRIGLPGTVSADSGSTFTLWGSGADIDNDQDAFRFVYQPFSTQGILESTVRSHSVFAKCAKAGIMIREHMGHGSPAIMLGISPADGVFIQVRYTNFGPTKLIKKMRASPPYRLRLIRTKDTFEAHIQSDTTWEVFAKLPLIIATDIYAGLAVTSCDVSVVSVAKFTEVSLQHNTIHLIDQHSYL